MFYFGLYFHVRVQCMESMPIKVPDIGNSGFINSNSTKFVGSSGITGLSSMVSSIGSILKSA